MIAALGYCAKLAIELIEHWLDRQSERNSRLIDLQSLLLATKSAKKAQDILRDQLCDEIKEANPLLRDLSYDETLVRGFPYLSDDQKLRHGLICSYTEKAFLPLNMSMIDWLSKDHFFKGRSDDLGLALRNLEAHLVLWRAKYEFWIPEKPERALVYLADEKKHGVGFPTGIENLVLKRTGSPPIIQEPIQEELSR